MVSLLHRATINNAALGLNGSLATKQTTKYITDQVLKAS